MSKNVRSMHIPTAIELRGSRPPGRTVREHLDVIKFAQRQHVDACREVVDACGGREMTSSERRAHDTHYDEARSLERLEEEVRESSEGQSVDRSQILDTHVAPVEPGSSPSAWGQNGGFRDGPFEGIPGVTNDGVLSSWAAYALSGMRSAMGETEGRVGSGEPGHLIKRSGSMHIRPPLLPAARSQNDPQHRAAGDSIPEPQKVPIAGPMDGRQPTYPTRLVDLLIDRRPLTDTNEYSWLVQTLRENKARTVPDRVEKPVSRYRMEERTDHCRVIAHLSEPTPMRFFDDLSELGRFLQSEMELGLLDAIEWNIISGDGLTDETTDNMLGLLNAQNTHTQAWDVSLERTLRKARTTLKVAGEQPTAWVLHPEQTEAIDLLREGADGAFLNGQFSNNILGALPVVESIAVDPEVAVLADWRFLQLIVRDDARLDVDMGGELFRTNQAQLRLEGRYGMAMRRTTAFNLVNVSGSGPAPTSG